MIIKVMTLEDYEDVLKLWKSCNIPLNQSDEKEQIEIFLKRNPDTSLVGVLNGKIIASVLGGYDGRRGIVHHLAVDAKHQQNGFGTMILRHLEKIFENMGVIKINFWVKKDNLKVLSFYEKLGYNVRKDIITMSKIINKGELSDENKL